jgi:hypothetical protein
MQLGCEVAARFQKRPSFTLEKKRLGLFQLPKITKSRSALKYRSSIRFEIAVSTVCSYTKWSFSLSDISEANRSPVNGGDDSLGGLQLHLCQSSAAIVVKENSNLVESYAM